MKKHELPLGRIFVCINEKAPEKSQCLKVEGEKCLKWLKDESSDDAEGASEPEELVTDAIGELRLAIEGLTNIEKLLENGQTANSQEGQE